MLANDTFRRWQEPLQLIPSNRLLQISGIHGCGKSILASFIVSALRESQILTLYFPFASSDPQRRSAEDFLRSTLWQLLKHCPDVQSRLDANEGICEEDLSTPRLWQSLSKAIRSSVKPIYLVLDAVDECIDSEQILPQNICRMIDECAMLRVLFLGRPHVLEGLSLPSDWSRQTIDISMDLVGADVLAFTKNQVESSAIIQRSGLQTRVIGPLMVNDLQRSVSVSDMDKKLRSLPRGLEEAFRLVLQRMAQRLDSSELQLARKILALSSVSYRPLTFEEMNHAQALDLWSRASRPNCSIEDYLFLQPMRRLAEICEGLVIVQGRCLVLMHSSAREFLCRSPEDWLHGPDFDVRNFRVDIQSTHQLISTLCLLAVEMEKPRAQDPALVPATMQPLQTIKQQCPFTVYAYTHTFYHLNRAGDIANDASARISKILVSPHAMLWFEYFWALLSEDVSLDAEINEFGTWTAMTDIDFGSVGLSPELYTSLMSWQQDSAQKPNGSDPALLQVQAKLATLDHDTGIGISENDPPKIGARQDGAQINIANVGPTRAATTSAPFAGNITHDVTTLLACQSPVSGAGQVKMLTKFIHALRQPRRVIDPLKVLFSSILARAAGFPVYTLIAIGQFYWRFDKFEEALKIDTIALKKVEHEEIATKYLIHLMIGNCHSGLLHYSTAQPYFHQAQKGFERILGARHVLTRLAWQLMGFCAYDLGNYLEAENFLRQSAAPGKTRWLFVEILDIEVQYWLGMCSYELGRWEKTQAMLQKWHTESKAEDKYKTLCNIGMCQYNLCHDEPAKATLQTLYSYQEKKYGIGHSDTLDTAYNVGKCCYYLGDFKQAEEYLQRSTSGLCAVEGETDYRVTRGRLYLGCTAYMRCHTDATVSRRRGDHADLGFVSATVPDKQKNHQFTEVLADSSCIDQGEAVRLLKKAFEWCKKHNAVDNTAIASICYDVGCYGFGHDPEAARCWLIKALTHAKKVYDADHAFTHEIQLQINITFKKWECHSAQCAERRMTPDSVDTDKDEGLDEDDGSEAGTQSLHAPASVKCPVQQSTWLETSSIG